MHAPDETRSVVAKGETKDAGNDDKAYNDRKKTLRTRTRRLEERKAKALGSKRLQANRRPVVLSKED